MKSFHFEVSWLIPIALVIVFIYFVGPILTPFLLGALLAYLIDPIVKKLETFHIPHLLSVILVFLLFFILLLLSILVLYPYAATQVVNLIDQLPQVIIWFKESGMPWLMQYIDPDALKAAIPATLSKTGLIVSTFLHSGKIAVQTLIDIVLTPVVTFYFLRDWDKIIANLKSVLPAEKAPRIIRLARECDNVLSAFLRGQFLVMLCLAFIYSLGLSIVGLKFGFIIGVIGGLLSLVPYLGSSFVLVTSIITSYLQFGLDHHMTAVLMVFLIGQGLEGYVLTPYLIGERIGLHPVAIIFAIMAGGTLFGFFGILLALPVAAVLMAIFRFVTHRKQVKA